MKQPNAPQATAPSSQAGHSAGGAPGELRVAAPPGRTANLDGPPSIATGGGRTYAPVGVTLHGDPVTGVGGGARAGWIVPVGVSLVTAFVVFAIGGLVVRGWRTSESTAVVTTTAQPAVAPAAPGVDLRDVVKPSEATKASAPAAPPEEKAQPKATEPAASPEQETAERRPAPRPAAAKPSTASAAQKDSAAARPELPTSAADYLPGSL